MDKNRKNVCCKKLGGRSEDTLWERTATRMLTHVYLMYLKLCLHVASRMG